MSYNRYISFTETRFDLLPLIHVLLGAFGILGNAFVCIVFRCKRKWFNSITNLLIMNQATIDLCASVLLVLLRVGPAASEEISTFGEIACRVWFSEYLQWAMFIASTFNLIIVSLERYLAICHPIFHRNWCSRRVTKIAMVLVWVFGLLYQSYWMTLHKYSKDECRPVWPNFTLQRVFGVILFLVEFFIPLLLMSFFYTRIILTLRVERRRYGHATVKRFAGVRKNVTMTLVTVFVSYVVCWITAEVVYLCDNFGLLELHQSSALYLVEVFFVECSMCINPLIYAFKYKQFRKHALSLFCRRCVTVDPQGRPKTKDRASTTVRSNVISPSIISSNTLPPINQ